MRENLVVAGVALCIVLATAGIVGVVGTKCVNPVDVSPLALDGDPEFYTGVVVRVPTGGTQPGPDAKTLVYRKRADLEPVILFEFEARVPDPVPPKVVGKVAGRRGPSVVVTGCYPAP